MFTGIIEELGSLKERRGDRFTFESKLILEDARIGDSTAVNGVCLTIVDLGDDWWSAGVSDETLAKTTIGTWGEGTPINLERPVRLQDRLGGHLVQGHVDGFGEVVNPGPNFRVRIDPSLMRYVVAKGSIAIDGVSLTVVDPTEDEFSIALIDHTMAVTNLGSLRVGDKVNIEVDVMAKYAEKLLGGHV